ncbi:MAG: DUF4258 domain-containing protein [Leptospirales bacterium]
MIRYDPHAFFQINRREILTSLVEETIANPDKIKTKGNKCSFLKCYSERRKMLRVVTREDDHEYVITAYFDRRKPCG